MAPPSPTLPPAPAPAPAPALALALAFLFTTSTAWAQQAAPPPAERLQIYSPYEQQTIAEVFDDRQLVRDPAPEGKLVERVDVVPLPPFEKRDIVPQLANIVHVTTREPVVRREVLLHVGGVYEQALVDDTIRNLRRLPGVPQLSAVIVVAARGSAPDRVVVVVITKDVWSLRLNWGIVGDNGGIDQLVLQPAETNFLGTHQIVGANFILEPSALTFGLGYFVPRLGDSRVAVNTNANVMVNRGTGAPEGTYGELVAGQPLFSGRTEWAWDSTVAWQDVVTRRYSNAQLSAYVDPATGEKVPFAFRTRTYLASYEATRSFGWDVKHDVTLGATLNRAVYQVNPVPGVSAQTVGDFVAQEVPVGETRVGPSLQYHTYRMRFVRVIDFDTLALQEDYRLGHDVVLRVYPVLRAFGSTRDVLGTYAAAQYTWALRDGVFRTMFQATTEPQISQDARISDASIQPQAHLVTPSIGNVGRLVFDASWLYRWRNYLNQITYTGGDDRLRGFPTNFFVGANVVNYNVEARTRPVEIFSSELAGVAFFDAGDAYSTASQFHAYQSVGVGVRMLFPWLDRTVFRFDFGIPLERPIDPTTGTSVPPFGFVLTFAQAFTMPTVAPMPVLATGQGPDSP